MIPFRTKQAFFTVETVGGVFFVEIEFSGFSNKDRFGLSGVVVGVNGDRLRSPQVTLKIKWWPQDQPLDLETMFEIGREVLMSALVDIGLSPEQILGFARMSTEDISFYT